jgi:hypothetical protein
VSVRRGTVGVLVGWVADAVIVGFGITPEQLAGNDSGAFVGPLSVGY